MINQQHFSPPPKSYTPIKQPLQLVQPSHKQVEKIALHAGDSMDVGHLSQHAKETILAFTNAQATRLNLHTPKWVYKRCIPWEHLTFTDLYLTQGTKNDVSSCHFATDAAGAVVCFNLNAFKTEDYLNAWDTQGKQTLTILDVFSITTIPQDVVKKTFGGHPRYLEFMSIKGYEVC